MKLENYVKKNHFKLIIGGEGAVGKTTVCKRLTKKLEDDEMLEITLGIDFHSLKIKNNFINVQLWDLGGQDQFRYFQPDFFKGASIVILIFSLDMYFSFKRISSWLDLLPQQMQRHIFLIGNKIDSPNRSVSMDEAFDYAEIAGMKYYEVSAKNGVGFDEFEADLIKTIESIFDHRL